MAPLTLLHDEYTVAWICALPLEMAAAKAMLDDIHGPLPQPPTDHNAYTLGKVHGHNVVIACLPSGIYGTTSATTVLTQMLPTFPSLRFGLMVGIGGGVPGKADVRLGDVVISKPTASGSGVIQYDYGKTMRDGRFQRTGFLNKPPRVLLTAISQIESDHMMGKRQIKQNITDVYVKNKDMRESFSRPADDWLFSATYPHQNSTRDCSACDMNQLKLRLPRATNEPYLHYGLVASGNQVMKDAQTRDQIAKELDILSFEMEAAGMMDQLPCLVIRGICDYCDSHKQKQWQGYASLAAAAYAKLLLSAVPLTKFQENAMCRTELGPEEKACLRGLFITDPVEDKSALKRRKGDRAPGTCEWIMETAEMKTWLGLQEAPTETHSNILWLYGNPGIGKSTIAITIAEELQNQFLFGNKYGSLAYFFCDSSSEERCTATTVLRGLLYHLVKQRPKLIKHLLSKFEEREKKLFDSFDCLWTILIDMGNDNASGELYCIIDALDECDGQSQTDLLSQINQTLGNGKSKGLRPSIHFLITSRPYHEIWSFLHGFPNKDLASYEEVQKDLQVMIEQKVTKLSHSKRYPMKVALEVSNLLQEKAEGTFLWVGIACDELASVRSRDAIKTLQTLPRGLDALYMSLLTAALDKSGKEDNEMILQMLSFVAVSRRPLTVAELSTACGQYENEDEENRLAFTREDIEMCHLMLIIQDEVVRLLHKSVKDFLLRVQGQINELRAHAMFATRCIDYILSTVRSLESLQRTRTKEGFLKYATLYWPEHASLAQREFHIVPEHARFFRQVSNEREMWLKAYRTIGVFPRIPQCYSIFHVAARWGISCLIHFALENTSELHISESLTSAGDKETKFDDTLFKAQFGQTPMQEAAKRGNIHVLSLLLEKGDSQMDITQEVLMAAAGNGKNGKEMMALLLDRRGGNIEITERVVRAAAKNWGNGREVMRVLLDRFGDQVKTTERVLQSAARNWGNGKEVMKLFFDRRGDDVVISERVIQGAAENKGNGKEVMALLLDQWGSKIKITETVVMSASSNEWSGKEVMKLLFDRRGDEVIITERVVQAAARNSGNGEEIMLLLLDRRGNKIKITEEVVQEAAGNERSGMKVMRLLLDWYGDKIKITEPIIIAVVGNGEGGKEVMTLLFDRREGEIKVTEAVVQAAARNKRSGVEIMQLILDRRGDEFKVTERVVCAAARNEWNGPETMRFLIDQHGDAVEITEPVMLAAAGNKRSGKEVMKLLLDQREREIAITESIIITAVRNEGIGKEVMTMLFDRRESEINITESIVIAAAANEGSIKDVVIFDRRGEEVELTEEGAQGIVGNEWSGKEVMELLLDRRGDEVVITERVVQAAAGNNGNGEEIMTLLLNRRGNEIKITEPVVQAAARNSRNGRKVMELLLDRRGDEIKITEPIIIAAAGNEGSGDDVMTLLLDRRGNEIKIAEQVVRAAAGNLWNGKKVLTLLLDRRGDEVEITEPVVVAAAGNEGSGKEVMTLLFDRRGNEIRMTERVVQIAAGNSWNGARVIRLLLDRRGDEIKITEPIIIAAAGNEGSGDDVMTLLLDRWENDIKITKRVIQAALQNERSGEEVLKIILKRDHLLDHIMRERIIHLRQDFVDEYFVDELPQRVARDRRDRTGHIADGAASSVDWSD